MKVTLRKFLEITGTDIIHEYLCELRVDKYDKEFDDYFPERIAFGDKGSFGEYKLKNVKQLEPYMDYEIYQFDQEYAWGEVDYQCIYLREIKED